MRRSLVATDETARHPFLASLPPHVRKGEEPKRVRSSWRLTNQDWRDFMVAYLACFMAVAIFIG